MEKVHKEILGLMGKIDIDCRDEKDAIIIDLAGQLDIYNSHDITLLVEAYRERGFHKFILNLKKSHLSRQLNHQCFYPLLSDA